VVRWRWAHPTVHFLQHLSDLELVRAAKRPTHEVAHWDQSGLSAWVLLLLAAQYVLGRAGCSSAGAAVAGRWRTCWARMCVGGAGGIDGAVDAGTGWKPS